MIFYSLSDWNTLLKMVFGYCPKNISPVQAVADDAATHQDLHQPMWNDHSTAIGLIHLENGETKISFENTALILRQWWMTNMIAAANVLQFQSTIYQAYRLAF